MSIKENTGEKIRDVKRFVKTLIDGKFGQRCLDEGRPFAVAFEKAVNKEEKNK